MEQSPSIVQPQVSLCVGVGEGRFVVVALALIVVFDRTCNLLPNHDSWREFQMKLSASHPITPKLKQISELGPLADHTARSHLPTVTTLRSYVNVVDYQQGYCL